MGYVDPELVFYHDGSAMLAANLDGQRHVLGNFSDGADQVLAGDLRDKLRELDLRRRDVAAHGGELHGDQGLILCPLTLLIRGVGLRARALGLHDPVGRLGTLAVAVLFRLGSAGFAAHVGTPGSCGINRRL